MADDWTVDATAEDILVAHQRHSPSHCLCGWSELGLSHADHQVQMLRRAGVLRQDTTEEWGVLRDVFTPKPSRESAAREVQRQRTSKWPLPARLARRYVTEPEEVRG